MSKTSNRCGAVQRSNGNLIEKTSQKNGWSKINSKETRFITYIYPTLTLIKRKELMSMTDFRNTQQPLMLRLKYLTSFSLS